MATSDTSKHPHDDDHGNAVVGIAVVAFFYAAALVNIGMDIYDKHSRDAERTQELSVPPASSARVTLICSPAN